MHGLFADRAVLVDLVALDYWIDSQRQKREIAGVFLVLVFVVGPAVRIRPVAIEPAAENA